MTLDITIVATTEAAGNSGAQVLDTATLTGDRPLQVLREVPLISQRHALVVEPSDATLMTIQSAATVRRGDLNGKAALLTASVDTVTIDRVTGQPVPGRVGTIQTRDDVPADPVPHTGLQYRFPFGTEKTSYPYFDVITRTTTPIDFVEDSTIGGVPVFHFHQRVEPVDLAAATPPDLAALDIDRPEMGHRRHRRVDHDASLVRQRP